MNRVGKFAKMFPYGSAIRQSLSVVKENLRTSYYVSGILYKICRDDDGKYSVRVMLVEQLFNNIIHHKFPGGGSELGDKNLFASLRRELREECQVSLLRPRSVVKIFLVLESSRDGGPEPHRKYFILCDVDRGFKQDPNLPKLDKEILDYGWVNVEDILSGYIQVHYKHLIPMIEMFSRSGVPELEELINHAILTHPDYMGPLFWWQKLMESDNVEIVGPR